MGQIEWQDSFSVNNSAIDEQHKKWIALYNEMHDILINGGHESLRTIAADSLKAMQDYARYHFNFEEAYMREIGYPDIVRHIRAHKDFDSLIYLYNKEVAEGEMVLNSEIIKIIREWLVNHILVEDKKFSLFAAERS